MLFGGMGNVIGTRKMFDARPERREDWSELRRGVWEWVRGVIGGKQSKDTNPIEEGQSEFLLGR